jgi:aromatic ring hydroxylase
MVGKSKQTEYIPSKFSHIMQTDEDLNPKQNVIRVWKNRYET